MNANLFINRQASWNYHLLKKYQAGIVLSGSEVKAIKGRHFDASTSYASLVDGEVWLHNLSLSKEKIDRFCRDNQKWKLLLKRSEINELMKYFFHENFSKNFIKNFEKNSSSFSKKSSQNYSLVVTRIFLERGLVKVEIALGQGKKNYDKRQALKDRAEKYEQRGIHP